MLSLNYQCNSVVKSLLVASKVSKNVIRHGISNPRNSILSHFYLVRRDFKILQASVFGRNPKVFGDVIKHCHGCLMHGSRVPNQS